MTDLVPYSGDPAELRRAFGCFPSGVAAVCALHDGMPAGMAASSFTSVSLAPALVSVCVQNTSATWPLLRRSRRIGISVLAQEQDQTCLRLAARDQDGRFAGLDWTARDDGAVLIRGAVLWLVCGLHSEVEAGDHSIALLEVHGLRAAAERSPLVFHGSKFRQLAPT
jgi:flavin reductase (DIM6/NTAB) family NADH-FMN oxidoreductase RutF